MKLGLIHYFWRGGSYLFRWGGDGGHFHTFTNIFSNFPMKLKNNLVTGSSKYPGPPLNPSATVKAGSKAISFSGFSQR